MLLSNIRTLTNRAWYCAGRFLDDNKPKLSRSPVGQVRLHQLMARIRIHTRGMSNINWAELVFNRYELKQNIAQTLIEGRKGASFVAAGESPFHVLDQHKGPIVIAGLLIDRQEKRAVTPVNGADGVVSLNATLKHRLVHVTIYGFRWQGHTYHLNKPVLCNYSVTVSN